MPDLKVYDYTFSNIATIISVFTEKIGLKKFAIYIFDYGSPVGLRLALRMPERISAIITQNGNAYEEGLSSGWDPIRAYWKDASQANRDALRVFLKPEATAFQYTHGVADPSVVSPDGLFDDFYLARPCRQCNSIFRLCKQWHYTLSFRSTSGNTSHPCWPSGARMIRSFFQQALKRSSGISLRRR
jgi:pimeloyl-ACP methyl ester carboxylesterase